MVLPSGVVTFDLASVSMTGTLSGCETYRVPKTSRIIAAKSLNVESRFDASRWTKTTSFLRTSASAELPRTGTRFVQKKHGMRRHSWKANATRLLGRARLRLRVRVSIVLLVVAGVRSRGAQRAPELTGWQPPRESIECGVIRCLT